MRNSFTIKSIIFLLFTAAHFGVSAQIVEPPKNDTIAKPKPASLITETPNNRAVNLYFEVGGPGLALTLNYDARFSKTRKGLGYRFGYGYFADGGNTVFTFPVQLNYLAGYADGSNFLEIGGGTTFVNSTGDNKGKTFIFDRVTGLVGTATLGYRYQPAGKGFNFRIGFVPVFYDEGVIAAGGVSFGITLK